MSLFSKDSSTGLRFHGIQLRPDDESLGATSGEPPLAVALPAVLPEGSLETTGSAALRFQGIQLRPDDESDSTGSAVAFPFSIDELLGAAAEAVLPDEATPAAGTGAAGFRVAAFVLAVADAEPTGESMEPCS